jgi:hypothetical protein
MNCRLQLFAHRRPHDKDKPLFAEIAAGIDEKAAEGIFFFGRLGSGF